MNQAQPIASFQRSSYGRSASKPPLVLDAWILIFALGALAFSLVMLYSATGTIALERFEDPWFYVKRQAAAGIIGFFLLVCASFLRVEWLKKISPYCFLLSLLLLLLPLLPGIGDSAGGASRWASLGPIRFQPGEFVKILFVLFMAGYFQRHEGRLESFAQGVLKPGILVSSVAFLYLLEPDFGSTVVIAGVSLAMGLAAGIRLRWLGLLGAAVLLAGAILIYVSPYRMNRVLSFLSPWEDASGKGYQLIQSLIAVGSGNFFGVGLGDSQQKLFFLPAAHTDFIYAVISEEFGFVGAVLLLLAFLGFFLRGMRIAEGFIEDTFSFSLALGLTLLIVFPALLNIGVVIGLLPTKGMVLPLIGYGGSSLMSSLLALGILIALSRRLRLERMGL